MGYRGSDTQVLKGAGHKDVIYGDESRDDDMQLLADHKDVIFRDESRGGRYVMLKGKAGGFWPPALLRVT